MIVRFLSPVSVYRYDSADDESYEVHNPIRYAKEVNEVVSSSIDSIFDEDGAMGLLTYTDSNLIKQYVSKCISKIHQDETDESLKSACYCFINDDVAKNKSLFNSLIKEIKDEITGQYSDGWGESFEQMPIRLYKDFEDTTLYVSFWSRGNWCIAEKVMPKSFEEKDI